MNLLLYSTSRDALYRRILWIINKLASAAEVDSLYDPESLRQRLAMPLVKPAVAVLVVTNERELTRLLRLVPLLDDVRVVLVLPEVEDHALVKKALQLRPRYCTYADSDLSDLGAVLAKMYQVSQAYFGKAEELRFGSG